MTFNFGVLSILVFSQFAYANTKAPAHDLFSFYADEDAEYDPHRKLSFKEMKARDQRRFNVGHSLDYLLYSSRLFLSIDCR